MSTSSLAVAAESSTALVVLLIVIAMSVVISLIAIIDIFRRSDAAFVGAHSSRGLWWLTIALLLVFSLLGGLIASLIYLFGVRPRVRAVERQLGEAARGPGPARVPAN